ncbi:hypothetical protein DPMN_012083, partial [Dreissena polymorpha]
EIVQIRLKPKRSVRKGDRRPVAVGSDSQSAEISFHEEREKESGVCIVIGFIRSQRGAAKLCYTKKKETKSTIRWECSQRRGDNCKGTVTSDNPVRDEITAAVTANGGQPHKILADKLVQGMEVAPSWQNLVY